MTENICSEISITGKLPTGAPVVLHVNPSHLRLELVQAWSANLIPAASLDGLRDWSRTELGQFWAEQVLRLQEVAVTDMAAPAAVTRTTTGNLEFTPEQVAAAIRLIEAKQALWSANSELEALLNLNFDAESWEINFACEGDPDETTAIGLLEELVDAAGE